MFWPRIANAFSPRQITALRDDRSTIIFACAGRTARRLMGASKGYMVYGAFRKQPEYRRRAGFNFFSRHTTAALHAESHSFWTQELGKLFPVLLQGGAVMVSSNRTGIHTGHEKSIMTLVTSPDSTWVASGSEDGTIILWDVGNGKIARRWVAHSYEDMFSLAFSPDSRYLVSGGRDKRAVIWGLSEGSHQAAVLEGHTDVVRSCAWSPSDDMIATGSWDTLVKLWDAHTFQLLSVLECTPFSTISLLFSSTGCWLFSGRDQFSYAWDVASCVPHKPLCNLDLSGGHTDVSLTAAFDSESTRLLIASRDETLKILDVETGAELISFGKTGASAAALSPDGKLVVTGSWHGMMTIWDVCTGVGQPLLEGHTGRVLDVCFSPCGRYIALASNDHTVRLWRTRDGSCLGTFSEHNDWVLMVAFTPDGKALSFGGREGMVIIRCMCDIIPADELDL